MSMVRYKREDLPPLSEQQRAELRALAERPDSEIDYSDIPPVTVDWNRVVPSPLYKPVKVHKSLRLDADIIEWLKEDGPGWQTRLNRILRLEMNRVMRARLAQHAAQAEPAVVRPEAATADA